MAKDKRRWSKFREIAFDRKKLSRHVKKAENVTVKHAHKFIISRLDNIRDVRKHIVGWLLLVGLMIGAVGLQYIWFQKSYKTVAPVNGGTYAEASLGSIDTLNPIYASTNAEIAASRVLFSSLYNYDQTGTLRGDLARNMSIDRSGTVYTFDIRDDVYWHDSNEKLTAHDIAFTINLIKNPEARSPLRTSWQDVTVEAISDTKVRFKLPAVYASFPNALTFAVLPKYALKDVEAGALRENTFSQLPIGSGPFKLLMLQNVRSHKIVQTTANENYYRGAPMLNRFEIHAYDSYEDILKALRKGEVGATSDVDSADLTEKDLLDYDVSAKTVNSGVYALFNMEVPSLKDVNVRRALQLATDTEQVRKSLNSPVGSLDSPFVKGQIKSSSEAHPPKADSKKASALLDKAGWKMKDGIRMKGGKKLEFTVATTNNPQYEKALESISSQWKSLGIIVNTNIVDINDPAISFVQNILQARNYDILLYELFIGADPDVFAYWHSSQIGTRGYNFSNYVNIISDAALSSARSRLEPALREAKYKTFANQWVKDVPAVGLYQPVIEYISNKHVKSVDKSTKIISASDRFTDILKWSVETGSVYKTP